jgi:hypothetical protein
MYRGYIKLWRKTNDSKLYRNHKAWVVWTYLLLNATHREIKYCTSRDIVKLQPGQIIIGRNKLAAELGMSPRNIRTCLLLLKNDGKLTIEATNRYSVVTIVNWAFYQGDASEPTNRLTSNRPASDQQVTTKQECKNAKNVKNGGGKKPTPAPKDFEVTPQMREWAGKKSFHGNIDRETEKFLNHHESRGNKFKSWPAAWRSWILKAVEWNEPKNDPDDDPASRRLN